VSYKNLQVWKLARDLSVDIHKMTLSALPKHEMYEVGSQIRRSIKSVRSNLVEGYGRNRYTKDYVRFLVVAHASCDETKDHLETLFETGSLTDEELYQEIHSRVETLSKALNRFVRGVERSRSFSTSP
jgi:four helix bundle protein